MTGKLTVPSPEAVWGKQLDNLKNYGYQLPAYDEVQFEIPLPDKKKLKLGPALLVDYGTPIDKQCQLLGIKNYLDPRHHKDQHPKPQGRWGWVYGVENGKRMFSEPSDSGINAVRRNKRRCLMTVEGLAIYRENPDFLTEHRVDLSGSLYGGFAARVPYLWRNKGLPSLSCFQPGDTYSLWGLTSALV